jgi:uncharacterized protein (DUF2147 family)
VKCIERRTIGLIAGTVLFGTLTFAQNNPSVGLWKNVEPDKTVFIRTLEQDGKLTGKVEKLIKNNAEDTTSTCTKCQGENKDKPVIGMTMIWGMQKDGARWSGGKILEPDTGKVYNCRIEPVDGGKKLSVRGSVAFLGKTQTWERVE